MSRLRHERREHSIASHLVQGHDGIQMLRVAGLMLTKVTVSYATVDTNRLAASVAVTAFTVDDAGDDDGYH